MSEILLTITHRSRGEGTRQDRSTLRILWLVMLVSVVAGVFVAMDVASTALSNVEVFRALGLGLFVIGLSLRWWAIIVLGRFFTVDVQIAKDHEVVTNGPFRWMRHPSYTGVLLAFLGFALSLSNWLSILIIMLPILLAFLHRIHVEEGALTAALGDPYVSYLKQTKRLVPGIY